MIEAGDIIERHDAAGVPYWSIVTKVDGDAVVITDSWHECAFDKDRLQQWFDGGGDEG